MCWKLYLGQLKEHRIEGFTTIIYTQWSLLSVVGHRNQISSPGFKMSIFSEIFSESNFSVFRTREISHTLEQSQFYCSRSIRLTTERIICISRIWGWVCDDANRSTTAISNYVSIKWRTHSLELVLLNLETNFKIFKFYEI